MCDRWKFPDSASFYMYHIALLLIIAAEAFIVIYNGWPEWPGLCSQYKIASGGHLSWNYFNAGWNYNPFMGGIDVKKIVYFISADFPRAASYNYRDL